jgi:hypothetical protein
MVALVLEPTEQFFMSPAADGDPGFPVRAWRGSTDGGTAVVVFIAAIAAANVDQDNDLARELHEIPGPPTVPVSTTPELTPLPPTNDNGKTFCEKRRTALNALVRKNEELWQRYRELIEAIEGAARHLIPFIADPDGGVPVVDLPPPEGT